MDTREKETGAQHLSPWAYMGVSFAGLGLAAGLLLFLVYQAPQIARPGLGGRVFYFALVPLGLATAAFIYGGMRSFAHFSGKVFSGKLELGGPVIVAGLTVIGGFWLVPEKETASLLIRVYGPGGKGDYAFSAGGTVDIYLQEEIRSLPIGPHGEVALKLSRRQLFLPADVVPKISGYVAATPTHFDALPENGLIELQMVQASYATPLTGMVLDSRSRRPLPGVILNFSSGMAVDTTDQLGNFRVSVPVKPGTRLTVRAWLDNVLGYNYTVTVPENRELPPIYFTRKE